LTDYEKVGIKGGICMAVDAEATRLIAKAYADDVKRSMAVDRVILFGSYAKGTATELSDIDICFFMPDFGDKRRVDIVVRLLDISSKYKGVFFEPTAFPTSEIARGNPFVKEILESGIEI
jgi:predicted nucleotidyltransferase